MTDHDGALSDASVLVTGASGFIGRHLCERLLRAGAAVHALSRSAGQAAAPGLTTWEVDAADLDALRRTIRETRPRYVFHLASHVMGAPDLEHVLPTFHANLHTTVNLLTLLAETGCERVVLTGSLVEPAPGTVEDTPSSPYAAAKWASSQYARMFHALYGLPTVIARVFMVYGPAQRDVTKLVPYTIRSFLAGTPPDITSGQRLIDWIYIDDVVDGFLRLATAPGIEAQSVDLGSGRLITIREMVLAIRDLMGVAVEPRFGALADRPMEPTRTADVERSRELVGWQPRTSLTEGLSATIDYYRRNP